jgi:hypothetical protein
MVELADGTNDSSTKRLTFQVHINFFMKSCKILCKSTFNSFDEIKKMKIKSFERSYEKKILGMPDAWLVDELFVLSAQRTSILYFRWSDFNYEIQL